MSEKTRKACPLLLAARLGSGPAPSISSPDFACLEDGCEWWYFVDEDEHVGCAVPLSLIRLPQKTSAEGIPELYAHIRRLNSEIVSIHEDVRRLEDGQD